MEKNQQKLRARDRVLPPLGDSMLQVSIKVKD